MQKKNMGRFLIDRWGNLVLFAALLVMPAPVSALDADLYLAGLGLHQETGRNIYLGGIYLEREAPRPASLTEASGTRVMEYRVVARRTSIRSLLGGMLLQSEVATGQPPDQATTDFADAILSAVNTSLYAGDSLKIELSGGDTTIARLNGYELARGDDAGVADYLLMGWVGESGPSTVFRDKLTAGQVDPSLLSTLEANTYSPDREAEVARWVRAEDEPAPAAAAAVVPAAADAGAQTAAVAGAAPAGTTPPTAHEASRDAAPADAAPADAAPADAGLPAASVAAAPAVARPAATGGALTTTAVPPPAAPPPTTSALPAAMTPAPQVAPPQVQLAALVPVPGMLPTTSLEDEIRALGVQEYSRRLSDFHGSLIRLVYGEIRYPKRAVRRSLEGRLELDLTITASGEVVAIAIAQDSGHRLLDEAAVEAAQTAFRDGLPIAVDPVAIAEFGDFASGRFTIPLPVNFRLQ